jgi:putative flippase GtrA
MDWSMMARLNGLLETNNTLNCVPRFLAVGMLGTLIDIGLLVALHTRLGVPTLLANTFSYSAGIVNNYVLHRHWTFVDRQRKMAGAQFSQFAMVSVSALIMNNVILLLMAPPLGALFANTGYGTLVAKMCATGIGVCLNFLINNFWTFRAAPQEAQK